MCFVFLAAAQTVHVARDLLRQEKVWAIASQILKMGLVAFQAFLGVSWRQAGSPLLSNLTSNRQADPRGPFKVSERREARDGAREEASSGPGRPGAEKKGRKVGTETVVPVYLGRGAQGREEERD